MILAISGYPRSGKTTVAKWLAEKLGYKYFYTGGLIEEAARALGIPKDVYYELLTKYPEKERELDHKQAQIIHHTNNIVVEGRIAPFIHSRKRFIKINILFTVDLTEAARRQQKKEGLGNQDDAVSLIKHIKHLEGRIEEERRHYLRHYHMHDHLDPKHFHIHIDTTNLSISDARALTLQRIKEIINKPRK